MASAKDVGAIVDRLITTDVGGRGAIEPIADAVADVQGTAPTPPMLAAETLADAVDPGDTVVVLTGFLIPPTRVQETDGPPGAAALSSAIDRGLDANPVIAGEGNAVGVCGAAAGAAGLRVLEREPSLGSARTCAVEEFPADRAAAREYADGLLDLDPAAVVAVEKVGPNSEGVYHNMAGYDISANAAKVDELLDRVDAPTIAVGDAGNEIGMGRVADTVRSEIPRGADCQCDCGEGIASVSETDVLVPAAVSNWGASAIAACLSEVVNRSVLHEPSVERRMLDEASMAGGVDGIGGGTTAWCDGLPPEVHESVVRLLGEVTEASVYDRGGGELKR